MEKEIDSNKQMNFLILVVLNFQFQIVKIILII